MIAWLTLHSPHVHITHYPFPHSPTSSPTFKVSVAIRGCGSQANCDVNNPPPRTALTRITFLWSRVTRNGATYTAFVRGCSNSDEYYPAQTVNVWIMLNKPRQVTNGCSNMNIQMFPIYQNILNPTTVFNSDSCYPAAPSPTAVPTTLSPTPVQGTPTAVPTAPSPTAAPTAAPTTRSAPTRPPTANTFYCPPFSFEADFSWYAYCSLGIEVCPGQTITISGGASSSECTGIQNLELDLTGDLFWETVNAVSPQADTCATASFTIPVSSSNGCRIYQIIQTCDGTAACGGMSSATVTGTAITPAPTSSNINAQSTDISSSGGSTGAIIGAVVGVLVLGGAGYYFYYRKQKELTAANSAANASKGLDKL